MGSSLFPHLSPKQIKAISAIAKSNSGIKASEFNKILASGDSAQKPTRAKGAEFSFHCIITAPAENEVHILFNGRHHSKNDINSWGFRKKLVYKSSIKKAFADAVIIYRSAIPKAPFEKVEIHTTITNPKSRDDDNNYDTLKIMRDCCTLYGIIKDDNRQVVIKSLSSEILEREYSILLSINKIMN